ncbi:MAG: acyl carrier protein [Lachnospiraceae bacterium]|jgi:acyl carrier protein|nr:acyl carrier protein [Lachnospiraceae bacterium]
MFQKITEILSELTECSVPPEEITRDTKLVADLDLSSFDVVNAIVMFEDEFNIEIPDDKIADLETVGDVEDFLEELTR